MAQFGGFEKDPEAKNKQGDAAGFHQKKKETDAGADAGYKAKNKAAWLARAQKKREQEVKSFFNEFKAVRRGQAKQLSLQKEQLSLQKELYKDLNLGIKHQKFKDLSLANKVHRIKGTASYGFFVIVSVFYVYWTWLELDRSVSKVRQTLIGESNAEKKTTGDPLKKDKAL